MKYGCNKRAPKSAHYVGAVLSPKSSVPLVVLLVKEVVDLYSPDLKRLVARGYYGESEDIDGEECVRQHAPGLCAMPKDRGKGFGTALYIGSLMAAEASHEHAQGDFPWVELPGCTFSFRGDRSEEANQLWQSLKKHHLAEESDETVEGWEEHTFELPVLPEYVDGDYLQEQLEEDYEPPVERVSGEVKLEIEDVFLSPKQKGDKQASLKVSGEAYIPVEYPYDVLKWETVKDSGLILHLSDDFKDPTDREPVPAATFAKAYWKDTPPDMLAAFFWQNAEAYGDVGKYLKTVVKHWQGGKKKLRDTLKAIAEESGLEVEVAKDRLKIEDVFPRGIRLANPPAASSDDASAAWELHYGAQAQEPVSIEPMKTLLKRFRRRKKRLL